MEAIDRESLAALRDALAKQEVEYLFLGKMAAILQGYPDTTQDADLFLEKTAEHGERLSRALRELGFELDEADEAAIRKGQDFVQLRQGPFPVDLVYAPDGIDRYEDARGRGHFATLPGTQTTSRAAAVAASESADTSRAATTAYRRLRRGRSGAAKRCRRSRIDADHEKHHRPRFQAGTGALPGGCDLRGNGRGNLPGQRAGYRQV